MAKCNGITKKGIQCKLISVPGKKYCRFHLVEETSKNIEKKTGLKKIYFFIRTVLLTTWKQILLTIIFLIVVFFLSEYTTWIKSLISIPNDFLKDFFSVSSQVLASLIGFFIAFFILGLEFIGSERSKQYDIYQEKIEKISSLLVNLPEEFFEISNVFTELVIRLERFTDDDIIVDDESYEKEIIPIWEDIEIFISSKELDNKNILFLENLNILLIGIRNILRKVYVPYVGSIILPFDFKIFRKLIIFLILTISLFLISGIVDVNNNFPDLGTTIILTYFFYFGILMFEFYEKISYLFRSLVEWN